MSAASVLSSSPSPSSAGRLSLMQAAFVVARRDFLAILLSKAFILFLLGPLLFVGISAAGGSAATRAADSVAPPRLAVALANAGERAAFSQAHARLNQLVSLPPITAIEDDRTIDQLLTDKSGNFAGVLSGSLAKPTLTGTGASITSWRGEVALIAAQASSTVAGQVSFKSGQIPDVALSPRESSGAAQRRGNLQTATAAITMLFLLSMLLAGMVLTNLVEEKSNKIIEILAASIPMDAVFLGKLFAMLAVSFVGITVWATVGVTLAAVAPGSIPTPSAPAIGWPLFAALFLVYFAMAYLLIGSVFLTVGAMAPTVRDVQTLSMPATILQVLVFFMASFAVADAGGPVETAAIAFPLSSPYVMLARSAQFDTLWWHGAAIAYQLLWVALFVRVGATLFRRKVMQSGPAKSRRRFLRRKAA